MTTRFFGQRIKRNEDPRLLTGQALFVDDVHLPRMAHVAFVRSPFAHARINSIDAEAARQMPGVVAIYTAADLGDYWQPGPLLVPPPPIERCEFHQRTQVPLAKDKVRHLGEPVAVIVAESRYEAEDAKEMVMVDYDMLDAVVDMEAALTDEAPRVHEDLDSNVAAHVIQEKGDYAAIRDQAHLVVSRRLIYDHGAAAAMENRGVVADWDARAGRMSIWDTTQAPIVIRNGLAGMLGLSESQVRVVAPFVGGGFGPKIMMFYPEEVVVPWLSMQLGRADQVDRGPRGELHRHHPGAQPDPRLRDRRRRRGQDPGRQGRLSARHRRLRPVRADRADQQPVHAARPLRHPQLLLRVHGRLHQQADRHPLSRRRPPARGLRHRAAAGPGGARAGIDRAEIRAATSSRPTPSRTTTRSSSRTSRRWSTTAATTQPLLDKAKEMIGYEDFVAENSRGCAAEGRKVGLGIVTYVEGTGIGPYEGARVQVQA